VGEAVVDCAWSLQIRGRDDDVSDPPQLLTLDQKSWKKFLRGFRESLVVQGERGSAPQLDRPRASQPHDRRFFQISPDQT
jgi:hypothetical protein